MHMQQEIEKHAVHGGASISLEYNVNVNTNATTGLLYGPIDAKASANAIK